MNPAARVPLSWRNLTSDRRKLLVALGGIAFAVVLMFTQIGFRDSMIGSPLEMIRRLDGDLFLLSPTKYRMHTIDPFPARRLQQALGHPDVLSASPVYMRYGAGWKDAASHRVHNMRVIAFDPDRPVFRLPEVDRHLDRLKRLGTVLVDLKTRGWLGPRQPGLVTELERRRVEVVGNFTLGTDFRVNGTVMTGSRTFQNLFARPGEGPRRLDRVEIGCLEIAAGGEVRHIQDELRSRLGADVAVLTREEFLALERSYWAQNSPIGKVFNMGLVIGFVVGLLISYQILFTTLQEQEPQFATLKAIGYPDRYLVRSVVMQAFLMGLVAFVPASLLSAGIYAVISALTGLKMQMELGAWLQMFLLTLLMCSFAGRLAVRKVLATDPAELFR